MASMCVQPQGVAAVYGSTRQSDLARNPQSHQAGLWRHDPMLPLQCLIDSKTSTGTFSPTASTSEESARREPHSRRRGKKKLLKKRKSLSSVSWTNLNSCPAQGYGSVTGKGKQLEKYTSSLPDVNPSSSRIDELSMPSLRAAGIIPNLVSQPHERRKKLPLLAAIKPENEKSERDRFMRANFNYNPHFLYRCPADEEAMERFNSPSDRYLHIAVLIMHRAIHKFGTYEDFEEQTGGRILSKPQIISLVRKYLKKEALEAEIQVNLSEDLLSRGSMTQKNGKPQLNVRVVNLREHWCDGLLRHELGMHYLLSWGEWRQRRELYLQHHNPMEEGLASLHSVLFRPYPYLCTHYLRSMNNRNQVWGGWRQRRDLCLQHHNPTEEGLASLHSVLFRPYPYLWRASLLYYVTLRAAHMSFKDLFMDLGRFLHDPHVRWDYCVRAKRGQSDTSVPGCFCKDQVYLEGALQLLKRRRCLDFHLLVRMGKVAHGDMDRLVDHYQLEGTRIPSFMEDLSQYRKQLNHIAQCNGLTDSVLADVE